MRSNRRASISADRDKWTKQAFGACIAAVKELVSGRHAPINPSLKIERLTDSEWGWFVSAIVSAWVRTRSEQASVEGWDYERAAHATALEPDPWFAGAIAAILPKLPEALPNLDWWKPVGEWSKNEIVEFLTAAITLTRRAVAARNVAEERCAGKPETVDALPDEICHFDGERQ
jgi:hypothetical protein